MALVATARVSHAGVIFDPGSVLPGDVDRDRLLRLGAAVEQARPVRRPRAKGE